MIETAVLISFACMLLIGIAASFPLYGILSVGLILFLGYGLYKGFSLKELAIMAISGLKNIGPILVLFAIIGCLTAVWRAGGTIATITYYSSSVISPSSLVVITFILCSIMSFITGSSYAAGATIGVICITIASAMHANIPLVAGAVLSGSFFGDRSSPLSATVNIISKITETSVFDNVSRLLRTGVVPYIITALLYVICGAFVTSSGKTPDFYAIFAPSFNMTLWTLLPTLLVVVLSAKKLPVSITMLSSFIAGLLICIFIQHIKLNELPDLLFFGYKAQDPTVANMINGGGIMSMLPIGFIISIASTYSNIFKGTGLLDNLEIRIEKLARKTTPFTGVLATSFLTTIIACDQVLSIMLTKHLCDKLEYRGEALALDLCNSSTMMSGFIPWSTVCVGILGFLQAPPTSAFLAFFNYITPLWILFLSLYLKKHPQFLFCPFGRALGLKKHDDRRNFEY